MGDSALDGVRFFGTHGNAAEGAQHAVASFLGNSGNGASGYGTIFYVQIYLRMSYVIFHFVTSQLSFDDLHEIVDFF